MNSTTIADCDSRSEENKTFGGETMEERIEEIGTIRGTAGETVIYLVSDRYGNKEVCL